MNSSLQQNASAVHAWSITFCFMLAILVVMLPDFAAATAVSDKDITNGLVSKDGNSIAIVLCNVIALLQGNIARGIAAGGVIFLGFSLFLGKISWGSALALGLGLGAIFGAQQIVALASNSGASSSFCST